MELKLYKTCSRCNSVGSLQIETTYNSNNTVIEEIIENPCTLCNGTKIEVFGYLDDTDLLKDINDKVNDIKEKVDEIKESL